MCAEIESKVDRMPSKGTVRRSVLRGAVGCAGVAFLIVAGTILLVIFVSKVPQFYPLAICPIPPAASGTELGG